MIWSEEEEGDPIREMISSVLLLEQKKSLCAELSEAPRLRARDSRTKAVQVILPVPAYAVFSKDGSLVESEYRF